MTRTEIIEKIKSLHELGSREMEYESVLKKCPEKADDVIKWLADIKSEIDALKDSLKIELGQIYRQDINCRCFIRISTTGSSGNKPTGWLLQLFHITDIYLMRKGSPWHEDVRYNAL